MDGDTTETKPAAYAGAAGVEKEKFCVPREGDRFQRVKDFFIRRLKKCSSTEAMAGPASLWLLSLNPAPGASISIFIVSVLKDRQRSKEKLLEHTPNSYFLRDGLTVFSSPITLR